MLLLIARLIAVAMSLGQSYTLALAQGDIWPGARQGLPKPSCRRAGSHELADLGQFCIRS